jgi:putative transposase
MPRRARVYLPDVPAHVVQRGNNRDACFFCEEDFLYYKQVLGEGIKRYGVDLHAYCLMTNHVHLLMTPKEKDSISRVLQHVGRLYVRYINQRYKRSGTLWEGRHKSSLVDSEPYLLKCYRYIELNPVVANMVEKPEEYPWSSYSFNGLGKADALIVPHILYSSMSNKSVLRCHLYRELFKVNLSVDDVHVIRTCLDASQVLGRGRFKEQI